MIFSLPFCKCCDVFENFLLHDNEDLFSIHSLSKLADWSLYPTSLIWRTYKYNTSLTLKNWNFQIIETIFNIEAGVAGNSWAMLLVMKILFWLICWTALTNLMISQDFYLTILFRTVQTIYIKQKLRESKDVQYTYMR